MIRGERLMGKGGFKELRVWQKGGDERETDKEAVRYFYIAKGSSAEVLTQATIAFEIGYIQKETFKEIEKGCIEISSILSELISARSKTFSP